MPNVKRLLCLANSRKLHGRCIAGLELSSYGARIGWIRPVSDRDHQEVSEYERQYDDGSDPRPLDIMDVPLIEHRPAGYQSENWLLDSSCYWQKIERILWNRLSSLADPPAPLWVNGNSTFNGRNDRIDLEQTAGLPSSLMLIYVDCMSLSVFSPGESFGNAKRRVQARFQYAGVAYYLWVTDPIYERSYLARDNGTYQLGESYLTVSLGEPYGGYCYKFIAAIMEPTGRPTS